MLLGKARAPCLNLSISPLNLSQMFPNREHPQSKGRFALLSQMGLIICFVNELSMSMFFRLFLAGLGSPCRENESVSVWKAQPAPEAFLDGCSARLGLLGLCEEVRGCNQKDRGNSPPGALPHKGPRNRVRATLHVPQGMKRRAADETHLFSGLCRELF